MKDYETVFVLHPRLDDTKVEEEIQKVKDIITQTDGEILDIQKWGRKRLAYEIRKIHEGIYTIIQYSGEPKTVQDLDRHYKLNENVLRHLTVLAHPKSLRKGFEESVTGDGEAEAAVSKESGTGEVQKPVEAPVTASATEAPVTASVTEAPVTASVTEAPETAPATEAPESVVVSQEPPPPATPEEAPPATKPAEGGQPES